MKLSYFDLLSFEPIHLNNVGTIKAPSLRDISKITFNVYESYLFLLLLTPDIYYEKLNKAQLDWYNSLGEVEKSKIEIYDLITNDKVLIDGFVSVFNFFFIEYVYYFDEYKSFILFNKEFNVEEIDTSDIKGVIGNNNFSEICDVLLQINGLIDNTTVKFDKSKVKNSKALELVNIIEKNQKQKKSSTINSKEQKKLSMANIISSLAGCANGLNIINIWDITPFQLYDQFKRKKINKVFDIQSTSVSVWGDEKNQFDETLWYENLY